MRVWQEILGHSGFNQRSQAFRAVSEVFQLFGIWNSESVILGSGYAGLGCCIAVSVSPEELVLSLPKGAIESSPRRKSLCDNLRFFVRARLQSCRNCRLEHLHNWCIGPGGANHE